MSGVLGQIYSSKRYFDPNLRYWVILFNTYVPWPKMF